MPIYMAISPERKLLFNQRSCRAVQLDRESGSVPDREFERSLSELIAVRLPISDGIDPVRELE
jgi:hypothetical protein